MLVEGCSVKTQAPLRITPFKGVGGLQLDRLQSCGGVVGSSGPRGNLWLGQTRKVLRELEQSRAYVPCLPCLLPGLHL